MAAQLTNADIDTTYEYRSELQLLDTRNRQLQERVEVLFLEKSLLEAQCKRQQAIIRRLNLERDYYLSKTKPYTPLLPVELWRYIFSMATHFDGFARSHWDQHSDGLLWAQSLSVRLSIPLVCSHWNKIGKRFLYERIVITSEHQIIPLKTILYGRNREYANFIFGLEISINPGIESESAVMVFQDAADIVAIAPRLHLFGLEIFEEYNKPFSQLPILAALRIHQHQLEALHLPTHGQQASIWEVPPGELHDGISSQVKAAIISVDLPKLKILSITPTEFISFEYDRYTGNFVLLAALSERHTNLETLSLDWQTYQKILQDSRFLRLCTELRVLHLITRTCPGDGNMLVRSFFQSFSLFSTAFPLLEELTLMFGLSVPESEPSFDAVHSNLQKIQLLEDGNKHTTHTLGNVVKQIYKLVDHGCLPELRHVVYHRDYPGGLLDCTEANTADQRAPWRYSMAVAKEHKILMSNPSGDPLCFWSDLHSIRPSLHYPSHNFGQDEEDIDTESERTLSDDYEYDIDSNDPSDGESGKVITDDSEDSEYAYKPARDVDYTTDSGSDLEF